MTANFLWGPTSGEIFEYSSVIPEVELDSSPPDAASEFPDDGRAPTSELLMRAMPHQFTVRLDGDPVVLSSSFPLRFDVHDPLPAGKSVSSVGEPLRWIRDRLRIGGRAGAEAAARLASAPK